MNIMAPQVRLPLVELRKETKVEIDAVLTQVCGHYPGYAIGEPMRQYRKFARQQDLAVVS